MDIRQCEDFLLVADLGSYAQRPQKLGLSVQTLNARIHSFEKSPDLFSLKMSIRALSPQKKAGILSKRLSCPSYRHMAEETKFISQSVISTLRIAVTGLWMPLHLGIVFLMKSHPVFLKSSSKSPTVPAIRSLLP